MLTSDCQNVFFCPFKAEAELLAANIPDCRKLNSQTWSSQKTMIFTWNGAGFLPMQKFLDCFPLDELKTRNIFLFGCAGSVDDSHHPGQIFSINQVRFEKESHDLDSVKELKTIMVLTKDAPVQSNILRQNIFEKHGSCLIDMESFHFIQYFNKHLIETRIIRFVSDTPSFQFRLPFSKELTGRFAAEYTKLLNL